MLNSTCFITTGTTVDNPYITAIYHINRMPLDCTFSLWKACFLFCRKCGFFFTFLVLTSTLGVSRIVEVIGTQTLRVLTRKRHGTEPHMKTTTGGIKMSIGIKPLGARVVIKKMEAEERTEAGLLLSGSAKEKPQQAEVLAVGPGTSEEPMELAVGDIVIFSKYGGTDLKHKGEEYTIINQKDILAIVE